MGADIFAITISSHFKEESMNNFFAYPALPRALLLAGAALCASTQASATEDHFYLTGGGGVAFVPDASTRDKIVIFGMEDSVAEEFDTGFLVSGAFGYGIGINGKGALRVEGELNYNKNDVTTLSAFGVDFPAQGDISMLSGMFNVYTDINTSSPFVPYLGAGIGAASVSFNEVKTAEFPFADDSDTVITWQFKAGTAFNLGRNLALVAGYRLLGMDKPRFESSASAPNIFLNDSFLNEDLLIHVLEGGLRYTF
jgi:opacity protein-like surface antigen